MIEEKGLNHVNNTTTKTMAEHHCFWWRTVETTHRLLRPANSERMIWTGRIRGCRMTAGHAWEQIKFTALDAGEFYQTVSVTEEAFLLFSLSVWFLLFLLLRKKKQEKWDKENPNANESSKTKPFPKTSPFSFSFTMKRRLRIHSKTSGRPMVAPTMWNVMQGGTRKAPSGRELSP